MSRKFRSEDFKGKVFGRLTIISDIEMRKDAKYGNFSWVKVKCSCTKKTEKYVKLHCLVNGSITSCNCRKGEAAIISRMANLNEKEKEIINGLLLGDGCLNGTVNKYFSIVCKSKEYIEYLRDEISILNNRKIHKCVHKKANSTTYQISSLAYVDLTELYRFWYPKDKKIVPPNLRLTKLTCLHWYIGDGHNSRGEVICLYTNGFRVEDVNYLIGQLSLLGVNSSTHKYKETKTFGDGYFIYLGRISMIKFLDFIGNNCPVKYFEYKWDLSKSKIRKVTAVNSPEKCKKEPLCS